MFYPYTTKFFENYAMLSLKHCYNETWNGFVVSGETEPRSPDLQDNDLNIGVEVTQIKLSNTQAILEKIAGTHFGKQQTPQFIMSKVKKYCPTFESSGHKDWHYK